MLLLIVFLYNKVWIVFMIEVIGWFFVNVWIIFGIVLVGIKVELINGRKISGYE